MIEPKSILHGLAGERPIFHSEADFQHALAWKIQKEYPKAQIRLEYKPFPKERIYLDLWIKHDQQILAFELKYFTRKLHIQDRGEEFDLKDQSAQDISRYDFIKDITRLERLSRAYPGLRSYAILLTNDSGYWQPPLQQDTVDAAFRIHEGRLLSGTLSWSSNTGQGTMYKRESPLALMGTYPLGWHDYSHFRSERHGVFRCLIVEITHSKNGHSASITRTEPPALVISRNHTSPRTAASGKYSLLCQYLQEQSGKETVTLTFHQIEDLIGQPLPNSAHRHSAWWANEKKGSHVQARAWMDAGWLVDSVDLILQNVTFSKHICDARNNISEMEPKTIGELIIEAVHALCKPGEGVKVSEIKKYVLERRPDISAESVIPSDYALNTLSDPMVPNSQKKLWQITRGFYRLATEEEIKQSQNKSEEPSTEL